MRSYRLGRTIQTQRVENQKRADERLSLFRGLPGQHKNIICQPLLEEMNIGPYLHGIELVAAGGEPECAAL